MTAIRLDGKAAGADIRARLAEQVTALRADHGRAPSLAVILVGEDPASQVYVRNKKRACEAAGITARRHILSARVTAADLRAQVEAANHDETIDGLLVQLPLPPHLDPASVRGWIAPAKDVDGLHPENVGLLASGTPRFVPCTPAGCLQLLKRYSVPTSGRRAVVVGRSLIVGRPLAALLSTAGVDATVTIAHSRTEDLPGLCRDADILVAAAGQAGLITADMVRPGSAVLDVGIHRVDDLRRPSGFRLVGDVDPAVAEVAGHLSPVPGGVGPMTIAMLLHNTVHSMRLRLES